MPTCHGFDASHYQSIDWPHVPNVGFAAFKATQGGSYTDPTFAANWKAARAKGIGCRVAYHFIDNSAPWDVQAQRFVSTVGPLQLGETLALDWEESGVSAAVAANFLTRITAAIGPDHTPLVYVGAYFPGNTDPRIAQWPLWLPGYTATMQAHRPVTVWQFSSSGSIAGIAGRVDVNQIIDLGTLLKACGYTQPAQPPAPVAPPPPPPAPSKLPARPTLKQGDTGHAVQVAQSELAYVAGCGAQIADEIHTATFGTATGWQVLAFQRFCKLPLTGQFDAATWAAVDYLMIAKGSTPAVI